MKWLLLLIINICVLNPAIALEKPLKAELRSNVLHPDKVIKLPISRNFDQGDSGLCWAYAMLSALETRYMSQHPGETLELSRGALQFEHFLFKAQSTAVVLNKHPEDGFSGEAIDILKTWGALPFQAYPDMMVRNYEHLRATQDPQIFANEIKKMFSPIPQQVEFQGVLMTPQTFAQKILGNDSWVDIAVARNGEKGLLQNPDSGAPQGRMALFLPLEEIIQLIKRNLLNGIPTAYATTAHGTLIYGASYDVSGAPTEYYIKDSFMGMTYKMKAHQLHNLMNVINTIY